LGAALWYGGLRACGATALSRRARDAGLILCYHNVVADEENTAGDPAVHLPVTRFEAQIRWLADHYDVISLRELVDRVARGRSLRRTAALTFDDGYAGVFEHAVPLLDALHLPATVFIVADAPGRSTGFWWDQPEVVRSLTPARRERWLTHLRGDETAILSELDAPVAVDVPESHRPADWATIRRVVGDTIDLGAHSATHRALPALTDSELEHEVDSGRLIVYEETGIWPEFFAYPYGLWDPRTRAAVRAAGYRAALSLEAGLNTATRDVSCLRRVNVPAAISQSAFEGWAAGFQFRRGDDA